MKYKIIIANTVRLPATRHSLGEVLQFMKTSSHTEDNYNLPSGQIDIYFHSPIIQYTKQQIIDT